MFPDIKPDTLLFNLYVDTARFFDNTDGVITVDGLKHRAKKALTMTREELLEQCQYYIDYWKQNRPLYIVRKSIKVTWGVHQYIMMRIRYKTIDAVYNPSKSVQENINDGIGVPRTTLYRYCKERGIPANPAKGLTKEEKREQKRQEKAEKIELFKALYDPNRTADENLKFLSNAGVTLSRRTLYNYVGQYLPSIQYNQQTNQVETPQFAIDLSFPLPHFEMPNTSEIHHSDAEPSCTNVE
jgi:hypothetical protein